MFVYKINLKNEFFEKEFILFQSELQLFFSKIVINQPKYLPIDLHNFYICFTTHCSYTKFLSWKETTEFKCLLNNDNVEFNNKM